MVICVVVYDVCVCGYMCIIVCVYVYIGVYMRISMYKSIIYVCSG